MSHRHLGAVALALGIALVTPACLAAQTADSARAPHVMTTVVVHASQGRPSAAENARLKRDLARFDARIATLQHHLDSLKTHADSLDRDRVHFEAAAAQARARRTAIEQRLRQLETRTTSPGDSPTTTP
jgi:septal ring factor EnvC (AmiA/AmiB activator)